MGWRTNAPTRQKPTSDGDRSKVFAWPNVSRVGKPRVVVGAVALAVDMAAVPTDIATDLKSTRPAIEHIDRGVSDPSLLEGEELAEIVADGQRLTPAP